MGKKSKIGWTDDTANPWIGCEKVSDGCKFCYAETFVEGRLKQDFKVRRPTKGALPDLLRWNVRPLICNGCGEANLNNYETCRKCFGSPAFFHRRRVFVGSMMDVLDDKVPFQWLAKLMGIVWECKNLDFLFLTKRPEKFQERMLLAGMDMMGYVDHQKSTLPEALSEYPEDATEMVLGWSKLEICPANVWFGVTVENQAMAEERIPLLLDIPAKVRWLSVEPMLEKIDLYLDSETVWICRECKSENVDTEVQVGPDDVSTYKCSGCGYFGSGEEAGTKSAIDWVVCGGESGPGARPFQVDWARDVVRQCKAADVACFVKQMGSNPVETVTVPEPGNARGGIPANLPLGLKSKKGDDPAEWPVDLRVQQWPEVVR